MRIEEELKLDYSDVLFRPKRSTLKSRKDVNLLRTYRFKYTKLYANQNYQDADGNFDRVENGICGNFYNGDDYSAKGTICICQTCHEKELKRETSLNLIYNAP